MVQIFYIFGTKFRFFGTEFNSFGTKFIVFGTEFNIFGTKFIIFGTDAHLILNSIFLVLVLIITFKTLDTKTVPMP